MFTVNTHTLTLNLEVVSVGSLLRHEAIIPHRANRLILEFKNLASLQNPIIVDDNYVVLDGNHRAHAFKALKFRYIPVCRIDYFDDCTRLRYWFRLLGNIADIRLIHETMQRCGAFLEGVKDERVLRRKLSENCLAFGLQTANTCTIAFFSEESCTDAVTAYQYIQDIQASLTEQGATLQYLPCKAVQKNQFRGTLKPDEVVIWTPQITKNMVVDAARQGRIFAPKTTRHVIPVRPLNVNIPGYWFAEQVSLDEINRRFEAFLNRKKMRRFSPGLVLDGRYYEEELVVFYD
jgi:hypothetical protein